MIYVPYWWDRRVGSLKATIHQHRPDLFSTYEIQSEPIPIEPVSLTKSATEKRQSNMFLFFSIVYFL